jgi:hypothetical protein
LRKLILISMLGLTGCAGYDRLDPPTVDMRDVDPVNYNKDLADCTGEKRNDQRLYDPSRLHCYQSANLEF